MKFYARPRRTPQVIIVSLIDIFAILLIFVIVTTTFKKLQPEVTIKLPESKSAVAADSSDEPVVLSVTDDEEIFLDAKKVSLDELTAAVQKLWTEGVCDGSGDSGARLAPTIVDGHLYAASVDGVVEAIDAASGRTIWQKKLGTRASKP